MRYVQSTVAEITRETDTYLICFFESDYIVPEVEFIDAADDSEAVAAARARRSSTLREIWERHRLVGIIRPTL